MGGRDNLPELPKGWVWTNVETVGEVSGGLTKNSKRDKLALRMPYLRVANVYAGYLQLDEIKQIGVNQVELERVLLHKGDLLVVEGNGSIDQVGRVALWDGSISPCLHQNHLIKVRFQPIEIAKYVLFWLLSRDGRKEITRVASSTSGLHTLSLSKVAALPIPVAPLAEQERIVAKIEEFFSELDAGVELLKKLKAKLKRYRQAVLKAAVEGKLTKDWREAHQGELEPASVLLERILKERREKWEAQQLTQMKAKGKTPKDDSWKLKYKEPVAPDISDFPELQEGWGWATIEQLSVRVQYGSSAKANEEPNGIPVLRMGNIVEGKLVLDNLKYLPLEHNEFPELLLEPGDLLFNRTNSFELVGKTAVYLGKPNPCSFASYLIRVRFNPAVNPSFVSYYLNSSYGRNWVKLVVSQQVGQANVNGTKLQALSVPLPSKDEQHLINEKVEYYLSIAEELEKVVNKNIKKAERLCQSILKKAFEGKLVPQDPTDEPADKLLERIKAEKAKRETEAKAKKKRKQPEKSQQLELF